MKKFTKVVLPILSIIASYSLLIGSQQFFLDLFFNLIPGNKSNDGPILVFVGYFLCLPVTGLIYYLTNKYNKSSKYWNLLSSFTGLFLMLVIGLVSAKIAVIQ